MSTRTIEIVGGGIAGLSLAVALRKRGVPVVLREAGSYPRHRLCGEFVNGVKASTLETLGLAGLFQDANQHQEMAWWLKGRCLAQTRLPLPVRALSRWQMDQQMVALFLEKGGQLAERVRVNPEPCEGRVWAAGRRCQKGSEWLGLKAHFFELEMQAGLEMHLGEGCYVGLTPVEEGRVNVCGLFRVQTQGSGKGSARLLNSLRVGGLSALADRLQEARPDEKSVTGVAGIAFGGQGHDPALLAIGDAERMIPPFTGNGMSMAFEAAEAALGPLVDYAEHARGWEDTRREVQSRLQKRFQRRIRVARGLHPHLLCSPGRDMLAALAQPGLLPFGLLNRILT